MKYISQHIYKTDHNNPYGVPYISTELLVKYMNKYGIHTYLFHQNIIHFLYDMTDEQADIVFSYVYFEYVEKGHIFDVKESNLDHRLIAFLLKNDDEGKYVRYKKTYWISSYQCYEKCTLLEYLLSQNEKHYNNHAKMNLKLSIHMLENHKRRHLTLFEIMIDELDLNIDKRRRF